MLSNSFKWKHYEGEGPLVYILGSLPYIGLLDIIGTGATGTTASP
jgi:hypothetical protein